MKKTIYLIDVKYCFVINILCIFRSSGGQLGIYNFRNQLLNVVASCTSLTRLAEKNNAIICRLFLDVFIKCETKSRDGKGLHAFLNLFGKFYDLQSMSKFQQVKDIAEYCLGHYFENNRQAAVGFFLAAYKVLRQHKVIKLMFMLIFKFF